MTIEPRSGWQKITQYWRIAVVAILLALFVVSVLGYWLNWHWTGLGPETSEPKQHTKTLWDWMQLLLIPILLAIGGFWLNQIQKDRDQKAAEEREKLERESREDNQHETALQAYINNMSELLLKEHLGELLPGGKADPKYRQQQNGCIKDELKPEYEARREIARVRTLTILPGLEANRKRSVLLFLHEAELLKRGPKGTRDPIINLFDADFSQAHLSRAHLNGVSLTKANLSGADLRCTFLNNAKFHWAVLREADLSYDNCSEDYRDERPNLREADFSQAYLNDAKLINVDLSGADLSEAILFGADLSEADLNEADLRGAKMDNRSNLSGTKLQGAKYNTQKIPKKDEKGQPLLDQQGKSVMIESTKWPQGFNPKAVGAIEDNTSL